MKRITALILTLAVAGLVAAASGHAGEAASPITAKSKLLLTVGPGFTITLRTSAGKSFSSMKRGTYTILVRDKANIHNAHLSAPGGVSKKTGISFVGSMTWKVKLTKAGTLKYRCDAHPTSMFGSRKIV